MREETYLQFKTLFRHSNHGYLERKGHKDYETHREKPTDERIKKHLRGEGFPIALYPITKNNDCSYGVIDDDAHHKGLKVNHKKIIEKLKFLEIPAVVSISNGGGAHINIFFDTFYPAKEVRHVLNKIKYALGYESNCEIFPKQNILGDMGSGVNLPYFGDSRHFLNEKGEKLPFEFGIQYAKQFQRPLSDFQKYDLLKWETQPDQRRNIRTMAALGFLKKHYPENWEDKGLEYNQLFNTPPLGEKKTDNKNRFEIMIKQHQKKDFFGPDKEDKPKRVIDMWEDAEDVNALMQKEFEEIRFCVNPILPEGLNISAGRPKSMKSWTALELVFAIQNGKTFMGHETNAGDCLYLALEDNWRRMQSRINKLGYDKLIKPKIFINAPMIGEGLEESIQLWIDKAPKPRLVVIDTLARVKKGDRSNLNIYDKDNNLLQPLQSLAIKNGVTIQVITHLNKENKSGYSFDAITGSTGMQGMSDSMWLISREENNKGEMRIRGRDINDYEYATTWNSDTWKYEIAGSLYEVKQEGLKADVLSEIIQFKIEGHEKVSLSQIIAAFGTKKDTKKGKAIAKACQRLKDNGTLNGERGYYETKINEFKEEII